MFLNNQKTTITQSGDTYIVDYGLGTCHYVHKKMGNRIKQDVLQLIKCDMWKVIASINEEHKLNEGDLSSLNKEIRDHSLSKVEEFIYGPRQYP
jgi:predicted nuclease of restriction endonuclease-like RecB superfamily